MGDRLRGHALTGSWSQAARAPRRSGASRGGEHRPLAPRRPPGPRQATRASKQPPHRRPRCWGPSRAATWRRGSPPPRGRSGTPAPCVAAGRAPTAGGPALLPCDPMAQIWSTPCPAVDCPTLRLERAGGWAPTTKCWTQGPPPAGASRGCRHQSRAQIAPPANSATPPVASAKGPPPPSTWEEPWHCSEASAGGHEPKRRSLEAGEAGCEPAANWTSHDSSARDSQ